MGSFLNIWRRSICAASGAMAGGIAGLLFGLAQLGRAKFVIPTPAAFETGILLGFVGWVAILIVVGLWLHYGMRAIAIPALFTSLITAVLTVFIAIALWLSILDVWIGLLVGTLVGAALCRLCGTRLAMAGGESHGVR